MGNRWGQGAQSALPMVGDFFQQAIKANAVDARARFSAPDGLSKQAPPPGLDPLLLSGAPLAESTPVEPPLGNAVTVQGPQSGAPVTSGVLSPPPIKYVNIQILPAAPASAADLPALEQAPVRPGESSAADTPRELPVLQMPAPRVVSEP